MSSEQQVSWETWTPEDAEKALSVNVNNRGIREYKIEQYTREMKDGQWQFCAGPVVFDSQGILIDGQHRLIAQVRSGITMRWLVIRNAPKGSQKNIDSNIPRTVGDWLKMVGVPNSALATPVIKNVWCVLNNIPIGTISLSAMECEITYSEHPDIEASVEAAERGKFGMTPIMPNVLGVGHWLIAKKNGQDEADEFVNRVSTLVGEEKNSPVLTLSERINKNKRLGVRVHRKDQLFMLIKAWNYDVNDTAIKRIFTYSKTKKYVLPEVLVRHPEEQETEAS